MKKLAKSLWLLFAQVFTALAAAGLAAAVFWPGGRGADSYHRAVARALPAVVSVYRRDDAGRRNGTDAGAGAGVIVRADGRILTAYHLVATAAEVEVGLPDGGRHRAEALAVDPEIDLAVLQIQTARELAALPFADDADLRAGDVVFAIGNPFGLRRTATMGIVSDAGRRGLGLHQVERFIQTDAAFNPGSSGGPLVNTRGELVGINSAVFSRRERAGGSGRNGWDGAGAAHGIGFAVPAGLARSAAARLLDENDDGAADNAYDDGDDGYGGDGQTDDNGGAEEEAAGSAAAELARFGVRLRELPPRLREEIYGALATGEAPVAGRVRPGSPAARLGLQTGDLLLTADGTAVAGTDDGGRLTTAEELIILRGEVRLTLTRTGR